MAYYSPYGLQGMRGMRAPQFQRQNDPQSLRLQGGPRYNTRPAANPAVPTFTPMDEMNRRRPAYLDDRDQDVGGERPVQVGGPAEFQMEKLQPNYPMYGGGGMGGMYGGRMGGIYGGGGYGAGMSSLYGGGMGGMYGGGIGGMMPPQRPFPGQGQYNSPLTNQFQYGLMGANPGAYSQSLRQMGYFQPTMPMQTDLQNLMGYQQSSFNPYLMGPTTTPDPNTTTPDPNTTTPDPNTTTGAATTTQGYTTTQGPYNTTTQGPYNTTTQGPYNTTTQGPYNTTTQGPVMPYYGGGMMGGYGGGMPMMSGYNRMPMMGGYGGGMPMMGGYGGGYGGGLGSMYRNYPIY